MAAAPNRKDTQSEVHGAGCGPEALLAKALAAPNAALRAKYATSGLSALELDSDTQVLLLRQLYLSHLEQRRYYDAKAIAEQMIELDAIPEVAHQDAARVYMALGDSERALGHLRLAGRTAPASRRGFHWWCLGSTLYALGCHADAVLVLQRSLRRVTRDKPLHQALLALARRAARAAANADVGDAGPAGSAGPDADLAAAYAQLSRAEHQPGVADWVGGELLVRLGRVELGLPHLRAFVQRNSEPKRAVGLRAEIEHVKRLIAEIDAADLAAETAPAADR